MPTAPSTVRLSDRVLRLQPSATFAVNARVREFVQAGKDVIGFGAGAPDFDTPTPIKQVAIDALLAGRTAYEPIAGPPDVRAAIAKKLADENGIDCGPDDIVINVGAKHSIYLALQALVDEGREVVVPTPAWVSYLPMVGLCGGRAIEVPGAIENDFKITPSQLEEAITPNTAAFIINSPSNPCGTMYAPDELKALGEVLARHEHVAIVSDEIYEKLIYGDVQHFSLGSIEAIADRVVTVNGLSKAFAMTGWRLGYACALPVRGAGAGDLPLAKAMARLQSQMTSHPTSFCLPSIADALQNRSAEVESMRQTFAARAQLIHGRLEAMPEVRCPRPTGAFYAFPDVGAHFGRTSPGGRKIESSAAFADALLEDALVAVVPGADFGACAGTHVRLSFACADEKIVEGCRRMGEWLRKLT